MWTNEVGIIFKPDVHCMKLLCSLYLRSKIEFHVVPFTVKKMEPNSIPDLYKHNFFNFLHFLKIEKQNKKLSSLTEIFELSDSIPITIHMSHVLQSQRWKDVNLAKSTKINILYHLNNTNNTTIY